MFGSEKQSKAELVYASAYSTRNLAAGIPDRKIIDGLSEYGLKILSIGSGDCADLWFLSTDNEIHALDLSPSAIEVAKSHDINAQLHNLENKLPFVDATFDLIVCKDLFEHLISPHLLLPEIKRVLKDEGKLVVSVPNHFYFPFRLRLLCGGNLIWKSIIHDHTKDFEEWDYMHLRFFTYKGLVRFLNQGGFAVEKYFWDFGTLCHYSSPDIFYEHIREKYRDRILTAKARVFLYGIYPAWRVFNVVFPRRLRHYIVGMAPGLLCAGFYCHCVKKT